MRTLRLRSSILATAIGGLAVVAIGASSLSVPGQPMSAAAAKGDRLTHTVKVDCGEACGGKRFDSAFRTVVDATDDATILTRVSVAN